MYLKIKIFNIDMAKLAIKGHKTRGKEVIEILEMLGGINSAHFNGDGTAISYYIELDNSICIIDNNVNYNTVFHKITLEKFLEEFPYKVGDNVSSKYLKNYKIEKMEWKDTNNRVIYKLQGMGWYSVSELQPYKEEDMETITIDDFKANTKEWLIDKLESMSRDNALQAINNIYDELHKPKYPKTYEECCEVLGISSYFEPEIRNATAEECHIFTKLIRLKRCRDAYWKIYGEEMGLGKPWEYDMSKDEFSYAISYQYGHIQKNEIRHKNAIFVFPTEEMRDAYKENFDNDIETCKEFL